MKSIVAVEELLLPWEDLLGKLSLRPSMVSAKFIRLLCRLMSRKEELSLTNGAMI
jgi:hypothetical protein